MTDTPIWDFLQTYAAGQPGRFHMPGHKGGPILGCEPYDLTEIAGADDLYHADGIIARSEAIASRLFGCPTVYSTEGSSLCIRAMLYLAVQGKGEGAWILAGRNAHKVFLNTAILLDFAIRWLMPADGSLTSCPVSAQMVRQALAAADTPPAAVYLTSPDYLGNLADIRGIAAVCHSFGVPLLVDNAHGAYLRFLQPSLHPMDLGADMCCDSAHKTLPVLTGGAYLHGAGADFAFHGKQAMALFGSTSPSYLILASLDRCNPYLAVLPEMLASFLPTVTSLRQSLAAAGYRPLGEEPMKLTLAPKARGMTGEQLGDILLQQGIVPEFQDPDHLVLMLTPSNSPESLARLQETLLAIPAGVPIRETAPPLPTLCSAMSPRQAAMSEQESLPVSQCCGRILASAAVSCPPAIPIAVCGERLDADAIALFRYYGIDRCTVVK